MRQWKFYALIVLLVLAFDVNSQSSATGVDQNSKPAAKLVDEFGKMNSEERSARFDLLFQEISETSGSVAYVLLYCGKKCRYGEIEAHMRGIELKVALRKFDRSRLVVVNAGFRESFGTELWIVPKDACPPSPKPTVNIKYVVFAERGKYLMEAYDCCGDFSDVWKNYKP